MKLVKINGAIITIDAMGTQTAIAQDIVAGEADFVLALKGNPESLYQAVVAHVDQHLQTEFADCGAERFVVAKKSHGRPEQRIVIPMPAPKTLPGFGRWSSLKTIAVVMLMSQRDEKETYATRYFISRLAMDVKRISHAVIKASKTPATGASISLIEKTSPTSAKPACARTSRGSIASPCRY